jgi:hypothetical protein
MVGAELTMATLTELGKVISEVEGIDPARVAWIGRSLREAGLISKHGRGPSAAHMGWTDAANVLIGVNAARKAANAAKATSAYRRFRPEELQFPNITLRSRDFTLGQAIEQLLVAAGTGELPKSFLGVPGDDDDLMSEMFAARQVHVELRFRTNAPSALLRVAQTFEWATLESTAASPALVLMHFSPRKLRDPPDARPDGSGDCLEETTIGFRTLREVGELIRTHAS